MPSGGMEIIMELGYESRLDNIIILTQYLEIEIDNKMCSFTEAKSIIEHDFQVSLLSIIRFKWRENEWKKTLHEEIGKLNENIICRG